MAKIVKTQEVEIGLEEVIKLIKKNWHLLAGYLTCNLMDGNQIVQVRASFNLAIVGNALKQAKGVIVDTHKLKEAIAHIFREIVLQRGYSFENMRISCRATTGLDVTFKIDIAPFIYDPRKDKYQGLTEERDFGI